MSHHLLGGSFLPPLRPGPNLCLPEFPLPCAPPGPGQIRAPSAPGSAAAWAARRAGEGVSLLPTGRSSRLFCRLYSGVLIIPAPGGIVPRYYTVDLYLIRHHLKPSAPSWHPCPPRIPHLSVCFYYSRRKPSYSFRAESKKSSLISLQQRPANVEPPGAAESRPGRSSEPAGGGGGSLSRCPPYPRLRAEMSLCSACLSGCSPLREPHKGALPAGVQASSISSA